jgi:predicted permease
LLLVSSGLLLRTLSQLQARDPGFRAEGVMTMRTWLPWPKYERTAERAQFYDRVLERARALPGVTSAAYISFLPMAFGGGIWPVELPGRVPAKGEQQSVSLRFATPQLFRTLAIPLRAGRDLGEGDGDAQPKVAVVSESFAQKYWPRQNALGKRFKVAFADREIVGVVGDIRVRGPERTSEPQVYLPYKQVPDGWLMFYPPKDLVVRASVDAASLVPPLREIIREIDPEQPISNVRPLADVVAAQTAPRRVQLDVIGTFALLAFLLAAVGIYGLLSFAVSNRAQEIGVRMALGATPASIVGLVLREGLVLAVIGAALGLGGAYAAGQGLRALLVGVAPTDVATFAVALALVLAMAFVGAALPAWRASRVDPATVLRSD